MCRSVSGVRVGSLLAAFAVATLLFANAVMPARAETGTPQSDIASASSGLCIAVAGASTVSGTAVQQAVCDSSGARQWNLQLVANGYRIVARHSGYCLTVSQGSGADGAAVVQQVCGAATNTSQIWDIGADGDGWTLKARNSGKCLDVPVGSMAPGTGLIQYACHSAPNQRWQFGAPRFAPTQPAALMVRSNGLCMSVLGGSTAAEAQIVQATCAGATAQRWTLQPLGDYFRLVSSSGQCLDVAGGSTADTARINQYPCHGYDNQQLTVRPAGDQWQFVMRHSGKCLAVVGAGSNAALVQRACNGGGDQAWSLAAPQLPAKWTAPIAMPIIPIAVANLPDGKLVTWSAWDRYTFSNGPFQTYTALFDPVTNQSSEALVTNTNHDMFCPGTTNLPDGRILVNGGSEAYATSIYDFTRGGWSTSARMYWPRGYQGNTLLADGSVLTFGGSWSGPRGGKIGELWTAAGGWRSLNGVSAEPATGPDPAGVFRGDNHFWLFTLSGGRLLHAGPHNQMNWITTAGNGTITPAGSRGADAYSITGTAAMYDIDRMLKAGGAPAYENGTATGETYVIDGRSGGLAVRRAAPLAYTRGFHNSVVLPDGKVLIVGGQARPLPFTDDASALMPELWDPRTEVYTRLAPMATPRNYHSTAILLADGRVFVGGGGQCGNGCPGNHFNVEILTPPNLLKADGTPAARPSITSLPATATAGTSFSVSTAAPVKSFALIRLSSVTHGTNNDQRRIPLAASTSSAGTYSLAIPGDRNVVLPGYYWLFALNTLGVPSVGRVIRVQ